MAVLTAVRCSNVSGGLTRCGTAIVACRAGTAYQTVIHIRWAPAIGVVTGLTAVGCYNMICRLARCCTAVVTGGTGAGTVGRNIVLGPFDLGPVRNHVTVAARLTRGVVREIARAQGDGM